MNNIYIDTESLKIEIDRLRKVEERLTKVFEDLYLTTDRLKDSWRTNLSEVVYLEFNEFYKYIEGMLVKTKNYISYLETVVKDNYISLEKNIDKSVDSTF